MQTCGRQNLSIYLTLTILRAVRLGLSTKSNP
nr:MAG TPA: hypothetical protein [Caudoviricetes sp.]